MAVGAAHRAERAATAARLSDGGCGEIKLVGTSDTRSGEGRAGSEPVRSRPRLRTAATSFTEPHTGGANTGKGLAIPGCELRRSGSDGEVAPHASETGQVGQGATQGGHAGERLF